MENGIIIAKTEVPVFNSKELNSATKKIFTLGNRAAKAMYEVAAILAKVQKDGSYKDDGFKNAADYAMQTFGFKKSLAYNLIKIGKDYMAANSLESNLPHPENEDFTPNQIGLMLPIGDRDIVAEMCENGELTPDMTAEEIRNVVKQATGKDKAEATEATEGDSEATEDNAEAESPRDNVIHYLIMAKSAIYDCGFSAEYNDAFASAIFSLIADIQNQ